MKDEKYAFIWNPRLISLFLGFIVASIRTSLRTFEKVDFPRLIMRIAGIVYALLTYYRLSVLSGY